MSSLSLNNFKVDQIWEVVRLSSPPYDYEGIQLIILEVIDSYHIKFKKTDGSSRFGHDVGGIEFFEEHCELTEEFRKLSNFTRFLNLDI